uniref:Uncharacterized protein MANES_02G041200 n=1 Tax=Rhizophora mucronata TaxID=61149 RepID=A0A2P2KNY9_RHIMU
MAAPFFSTPFQPYVYQSQEDVITPFQILGGEAQVVQIMLKPQERVIARPGSMCFMSSSVEMENTFIPENEVGVWHWLFGKTVTSIVLRNSGPTDGFVGIAAPSLARILPVCSSMHAKLCKLYTIIELMIPTLFLSQQIFYLLCGCYSLFSRLIWPCLVERFYARYI